MKAAIRSMTGFGSASGDGQGPSQGGALRVEVRAVNHRYLQVKIRIPAELGGLEPEIDELVRSRLARGSVVVTISAQAASGLPTQLNVEAARHYQHLLRQLAGELGIEGEPSLELLMGLPGVVKGEEDPRAPEDAMEEEGGAILGLVRTALEELQGMREREGAALLAELHRHRNAILRVLERLKKRMPAVVRGHHRNLRRRMAELLGQRGALPAADLSRELALLAERMDVGEEISRLESHLDQFAGMLGKGGSVGRQLEFLSQELLREANTIGSKCADARAAHLVVELKTHIDRLREQVQNVE
jgi:uncharacterized protein (TIGR00255 family)